MATVQALIKNTHNFITLYMLEYKPGLLFPSWLLRPGFKTRMACKWDRHLFMQYCADSWLHGARSARAAIQQPLQIDSLPPLQPLPYRNAFRFWTIGLTNVTVAATESLYSFAIAIASATKTTPQIIPQNNRCHAPSEAPGLYLRPGFYFLKTLANSWLLNETGVYLGEASI